jgi:hypothetical protein
MTRRAIDSKTRDLSRSPASALLWWGLPLIAGMLTNVLPVATTGVAAVWTVALVWMGVGCGLNALRCGRLHCYIAAPALLVGAAAVALAASGLAPFPMPPLSLLINGALGVALLSFLVEPIWGMYAARASRRSPQEQAPGPHSH